MFEDVRTFPILIMADSPLFHEGELDEAAALHTNAQQRRGGIYNIVSHLASYYLSEDGHIFSKPLDLSTSEEVSIKRGGQYLGHAYKFGIYLR
jgi:hypothetical protein